MSGSFYPNQLISTNKVTVGSSAPSSPANNDLWFETGNAIYPEPWVYDSGLTAWRSSPKTIEFDNQNASTISVNAFPTVIFIPRGSSIRIKDLVSNIATNNAFTLDVYMRQSISGSSTVDTLLQSQSYSSADYTTYTYAINQTFSVGSYNSHLSYATVSSSSGSYIFSSQIVYYHLR